MSENICKKEHRYYEEYFALPEDQGGGSRHICSACAFEAGMMDGLNGTPLRDENSLKNLPQSQAGKVRHKDAYMAYKAGYKKARESIKHPSIT